MPNEQRPEKGTKKVLIISFLVVGILLLGLRVVFLGSERMAEEDTAWRISMSGRFNIDKDNTVIRIARPKTGRYHHIINRSYHYPGLKLLKSKESSAGYTPFLATQNGTTELVLEYVIRIVATPKPELLRTELEPGQREKNLQALAGYEPNLTPMKELNTYLNRNVDNKEQLLDHIFHYSQSLVRARKGLDKASSIIRANKASALGRAKMMVALCRMNDIPARLVTGFVMAPRQASTPHHWVQVYDEEARWIPFDPEKGYAGELPKSYIAFNYNNDRLFEYVSGDLLSFNYSVSEDKEILYAASLNESGLLDIFELRRLDFETRETLTRILLLPFCVLLTAFLRHVVGLYPYGTFTASLLALGMVYAETTITLIVAGIVIALALLGRSILPRTLTRTPRLSLIFTFVSLSMVLSISVLAYFDINTGGNIVLVPIIILVAVVDRFYSYMDKSGFDAALTRLGVTVLIAIACIPILETDSLGILVLHYPEIHLLTAAMVLLFSSYKGKRITDNKYLAMLGVNKKSREPD